MRDWLFGCCVMLATIPRIPLPRALRRLGKRWWLDHVSHKLSPTTREVLPSTRPGWGWEILHDDGQKQCTMKVGNVAARIRNGAG